MEQKRQPIRKKVQRIVLLISVAGLLLTSAVGLFSMLRIKGDSENALIRQMNQNLLNIVKDKADLADSELGKYAAYIRDFAAYIHGLYLQPEDYVQREVLPPDAGNAGVCSMQRYLVSPEVSVEATAQERKLLGNLEQVWAPALSGSKDMITTIYVGTQSGFLLSYDDCADLGVTPGSDESYFDYFQSSWYTAAMEAGTVLFTDTYPDAYGRGLMISCAAPFYDAKDQFAGVVCMDILIGDLTSYVIDVSLGEGAYAFLVNASGDIIASAGMTATEAGFESILDASSAVYEVSAPILDGQTGVTLTSGGVYYAYTPVSSANWRFCVHIPESLVLAPVKAMERNIIAAIFAFVAALALIIFCVVLMVRRFSRRLTAPLTALGQDVQTISSGDLDYRAEIRSNDEIGDLAGSFNSMAASLKQHIENLTAVTAEKERIGAELDVATHIQKSMLPCIFPAFPERKEFDVYATMNPAKEVGGDFYDFFMVDDTHLAVVMADVSGKGVPAALFMVIGKTLIKDHTQPGLSLGEVFTDVNNMLCDSNSEGLFITAFEGVLDLVTGEFRYVNAGHEPPYICKQGEGFEAYRIKAGFVLAGMEDLRYREGSLQLTPGDRIFLYTDGVTEATDGANQLYGSERLHRVLNANRDADPEALLTAVKADVDQFVGDAPQFDDITMLCMAYRG
ncbi:MAG: SpoIIE family protein phosphatase [Clostridiales bacterium]|nr:SpoIIE family protein phosphatase [Clostridiales bacterium]